MPAHADAVQPRVPEEVRLESETRSHGDCVEIAGLRALGDIHVTGRDRGVVELLIDVPSEGIPELFRHTVRAAARGELQRDAR